MAVALSNLEKYLNELLTPERFKDYCPNGLIVEGGSEVSRGITGVSLTIELIEEAIARKADFVFVHHPHGFWDKQLRTIKGVIKNKLSLLLEHNISLFGYHLPLDGHPEVGNNAQIAKALGLEIYSTFMKDYGTDIGVLAKLPKNLTMDEFQELVSETIGSVKAVFPYGPETVSTIAICSGGAPDGVKEAIGVADLYLTGEAREHTQSLCKEEGANFIAAGHHATEVYGPQAIAGILKKELGLDVDFMNIPNPI
ncbi:MAG: Nif3-like dinuclear metal center hexameric protein [Fibrobacterales bacterium]